MATADTCGSQRVGSWLAAGATRAPDLCGVGAEMHMFLLASQGSSFVGSFFCQSVAVTCSPHW